MRRVRHGASRVGKAHSELAPYRLPHLLVAAAVAHGPLVSRTCGLYIHMCGSGPQVVKRLFDAACAGTTADRPPSDSMPKDYTKIRLRHSSHACRRRSKVHSR